MGGEYKEWTSGRRRMSSSDTPLQDLLPMLRALRSMGGFPFHIVEQKSPDATEEQRPLSRSGGVPRVLFKRHQPYIVAHTFKILLNIILQMLLYSFLGYNEAGIGMLLQRMRERGLTTTHFISTLVIFISNSFGLLAFLYCVNRLDSPLNQLSHYFAIVSSSLNMPIDKIRKLSRTSLRTIYLLYALNAGSSVIAAACTSALLYMETLPFWSIVLNFMITLLTCFDIYFPQTAVASHLLSIQSLGIVSLQMDAYVDRLTLICSRLDYNIPKFHQSPHINRVWSSISFPADPAARAGRAGHPRPAVADSGSGVVIHVGTAATDEPGSAAGGGSVCGTGLDAFDEIVDLGFMLTDTVQQCEETFATFIFMEFVVCLVTGVFGLFFGLLIFGAVVGSEFLIIPFLFGVFPGILALSSFMRIIALLQAGQRIANSAKAAKNGLVRLLIGCFQSVSEYHRCRASMLIAKFQEQGVIKPHASFELNCSTGLSLTGLLLTYMIVLLQFNFSEKVISGGNASGNATTT